MARTWHGGRVRHGRMRRTGWLAAAAAAGSVTGAAAVTVAVVVGAGSPLSGYVSESGVGDGGYPLVYRSGVVALAVSLLLLAGALRPVRAAAWLLVTAGSAATVSAAVPCRAGCPLPPHDPVTASDLIHGGASIVAVACCVFAMVAIWWSPVSPRALRRLAFVSAVTALPVSGAIGLAMLLIGGGLLVGVLERLLLLVITVWCLVSGVRIACGFAQHRDPVQNSTVAKEPTLRKPHRR
ncbi:DUF998 domain-containing protein [Solwaraspora sp. WMMB335]|uniref:DUF998 domain-containing protein n=1 Tax=Solwaraspora sp. WMMB335 TaxID=3404118 RepID=UPI003B93DCF5